MPTFNRTEGLLLFQRWFMAAVATLALIMALFPPYVLITPLVRMGVFETPEKIRFVGYFSLFYPPSVVDVERIGVRGSFDDEDWIEARLNPETPEKRSGLDIINAGSARRESPEIVRMVRMVRIDTTRFYLQLSSLLTMAAFVAYATRPVSARAAAIKTEL